MSQVEELERVKDRIRRLLAKKVNNGCTEGEAHAAAEKVGELLQQYNLSMSKIQLNEQECITKEFFTNRRNRDAQVLTVSAVGEYCDCISWFERKLDGVYYKFFGLEYDAELAVYLCDVIRKAIDFETKKYKNTDPYYLGAKGDPTRSRKSMTNTFKKAMSLRLSKRIEEMKEENRRCMAEQVKLDNCKSTDIIHLKSKKRNEEWKEYGIKLRSAPAVSIGPMDRSAASAGTDAADRVNLTSPIEGNSKSVEGYIE